MNKKCEKIHGIFAICLILFVILTISFAFEISYQRNLHKELGNKICEKFDRGQFEKYEAETQKLYCNDKPISLKKLRGIND